LRLTAAVAAFANMEVASAEGATMKAWADAQALLLRLKKGKRYVPWGTDSLTALRGQTAVGEARWGRCSGLNGDLWEQAYVAIGHHCCSHLTWSKVKRSSKLIQVCERTIKDGTITAVRRVLKGMSPLQLRDRFNKKWMRKVLSKYAGNTKGPIMGIDRRFRPAEGFCTEGVAHQRNAIQDDDDPRPRERAKSDDVLADWLLADQRKRKQGPVFTDWDTLVKRVRAKEELTKQSQASRHEPGTCIALEALSCRGHCLFTLFVLDMRLPCRW
jgi:hypothetical protein